jgi:hypothetical protein
LAVAFGEKMRRISEGKNLCDDAQKMRKIVDAENTKTDERSRSSVSARKHGPG